MSSSKQPVLAISPHLDDAVFGCGQCLAAHPGSRVITVFAGTPSRGDERTDWDQLSGFDSARDAVETRRREDRAALARLRAEPVWLDFIDSQYGEPADVADIAESMAAVLRDVRPALVLIPLGLFHSDHALVHDAALATLPRLRPSPRVLAYEDALYRRIKGLLQHRLSTLEQQGVIATPARVIASAVHEVVKRDAVRHYTSQLRAFGPKGHTDLSQPERYWELSFPAPGHQAGSTGRRDLHAAS